MEIIQQLDQLIANLDQQPSSKDGSTSLDNSNSRSSAGVGRGTDPGLPTPSAGRSPETASGPFLRESARRYWGHLPDQVQEQIQTPLHENFLPSYRGLIADYYKRLSQQEGR